MRKYNFRKIEKKWADKWLGDKTYEPGLKTAKKPYYNLMMFPYPSAEGLHVGNMYAFVGSDIHGRFKRMQGHNVFEPIGLDGFGIHSENYAMKIGAHPTTQSKKSEKNFYNQLKMIGNGFAWEEKLETYDPEYYKWTQWLFLTMYKRGLAYKKKSEVNWCPSCKTVLADEQVEGGKCERCDTEVTKKELEQWFFKITKYADKLLKNLDKIDWSERIKIAQRNWIGKSEGAEIEFLISNSEFRIKVFTTRPETLFGATYLVLAPEHLLLKNNELGISNYREIQKYIKKAEKKSDIERLAEGKEKSGVELKGIKAINPANGLEIPVYIADYVLGGYGTGAVMAVPAHDDRDFEFAKKYKLPVNKVIDGGDDNLPYVLEGKLVNSDKFDGMDFVKAKREITKFVNGKWASNFRLRDWLISRQRYWGPPIPIIYCDECGTVPVPEKDLPVKLPYVKNFRPTGTGRSPLASVKSFYEVKCPRCGAKARRETDVSDTFLDSSWYFFRYIDHKNKTKPFDKLKAKKWLPVDMYIGGAEHSVLHLLYTRFVTMVLKDEKLIDFEEPFPKFRAHGLLIKEGMKMSKSKGNVVNPDEYIKRFGADTLRTYLMFLGPFQQGGDWRDEGIIGVVRFLNRVWAVSTNYEPNTNIRMRSKVSDWMHSSIRKITEDVKSLNYNTAISEMMIVLKKIEGSQEKNRADFEVFLRFLAPFAPYITEELWSILGNDESIHAEKWPKYDEDKIHGETFDLIIQVNGKFITKTQAEFGIEKEDAEKLAISTLKDKLDKKDIKKTIFVPNKLINFVL